MPVLSKETCDRFVRALVARLWLGFRELPCNVHPKSPRFRNGNIPNLRRRQKTLSGPKWRVEEQASIGTKAGYNALTSIPSHVVVETLEVRTGPEKELSGENCLSSEALSVGIEHDRVCIHSIDKVATKDGVAGEGVLRRNPRK